MPFDYGLVKLSCVAIAQFGPILFGSLEMELFIFGKDLLVLMSEMILELEVLRVRWLGLLRKKLVLNSL